MSIRRKFLILLLATSLVPIVVVSVMHRTSTHRLGNSLAGATHDRLVTGARRQLELLVRGFAASVRREAQAVELALEVQARQVERRLALPAPKPADMLNARDVDPAVECPPGMELSRYHRRMRGGRLEPMPVDYDRQVYFLPRGVKAPDVAEDLARLSAMTDTCRLLHRSQPDLIYWQYTSLASGLHTSYPAHGPFPEAYDPRERAWYLLAKAARAEAASPGEPIVWNKPIVDASTRVVTVTASRRVRRPDGSLAGVTAIDMPLFRIFERLALPEAWADGAKKMLVTTGPPGKEPLVCLAQSYQQRRLAWDTKIELAPLRSDDAAQLAEVLGDLRAGAFGVREVLLDGRETIWAYGQTDDESALVIVVPKENVVAPAERARREVLAQMWSELKLAGIVLILVLILVVLLAVKHSRTVTRPIGQLAQAAIRVAGGDFETHVNIRTRDELHKLGETFNDMTAGLAERDRMKRSLALAMEIQQHLLPQAPPTLEGFDIVGQSQYCDETGGDYYDFIDLVDLAPGRLGIALGDVTGHGIGAALLMTTARAILRSHAGRYDQDLAALFDSLNDHLVRDTGEDWFMTLFYGVLDATQRSLLWASAGHDPAMWIRKSSGEIDELPNTGIPLGVIEEVRYTRGGPVRMESGDVILIGTDGIWEAANTSRDMFGKDRLRDILRANADRTAGEIRDAIARAVAEFRGEAPQADDITLVVIRAL